MPPAFRFQPPPWTCNRIRRPALHLDHHFDQPFSDLPLLPSFCCETSDRLLNLRTTLWPPLHQTSSRMLEILGRTQSKVSFCTTRSRRKTVVCVLVRISLHTAWERIRMCTLHVTSKVLTLCHRDCKSNSQKTTHIVSSAGPCTDRRKEKLTAP